MMNSNIKHKTEVKSVSKAAEEFSKSLYGVIKETEQGNILFSPYSVAAVLAMLSEGARGKTLEMMKRTMQLPETEIVRTGYQDIIPALRTNENFTLDTANTAFVMKDFKVQEEFQTSLQENYHAAMSPELCREREGHEDNQRLGEVPDPGQDHRPHPGGQSELRYETGPGQCGLLQG